MLARVSHVVGRTGAGVGIAAVGVAGATAAVTIVGQYGIGRDFRQPAPPGFGALALAGVFGVPALTLSVVGAFAGETAQERSLGRGTLAVTLGMLGGTLVVAPAIRRVLAGD
jgi:hypothetical protein